MAGFEPALSCSRSTRNSQTFPHAVVKSTQPESNRHFLHGKQIGIRYIMGALSDYRIVKEREHWAGVEPTFPRYECGVLPLDDQCLFVRKWDQTDSNRHQVRLRARYAAVNTLIPCDEGLGGSGLGARKDLCVATLAPSP